MSRHKALLSKRVANRRHNLVRDGKASRVPMQMWDVEEAVKKAGLVS
jgi:hypothetical protein